MPFFASLPIKILPPCSRPTAEIVVALSKVFCVPDMAIEPPRPFEPLVWMIACCALMLSLVNKKTSPPSRPSASILLRALRYILPALMRTLPPLPRLLLAEIVPKTLATPAKIASKECSPNPRSSPHVFKVFWACMVS